MNLIELVILTKITKYKPNGFNATESRRELAALHLLKSKDSFLRALMDSTNQEHLKGSYN